MSISKSDRDPSDGKDVLDSPLSIIKSTSILSIGTLSSRILGFIRDITLAKFFGTTYIADAFFTALRIPNLFRDMVGEGAVNAAIVPVFSEYKEREKKEQFWNFISIVFSLGLIALSIVTILGILFAPVIVRVIVPGFMAEPGKLLLTIKLTKIMFPYLIFIGLTAYCIGILHTFRSFIVPAFSPCLFNIAIIISAVISSRTMDEPILGVAIGVLIGGILQLLVQIRPLIKTGIHLKRPKSFNHPGAKKIGRLLIPRIIGSGVYQLTILIDIFCASMSSIVGSGGISAIYFANRIVNFPMGIFSVALSSALLPTLSGFAIKNDTHSIKKTLAFSLENIFYVMCPSMVFLILLATPIIQVLFQRGEFGYQSTTITASALTFYAMGLFSFGGIKILVTAFHALQDTKTPVKVAAFCLVINAALNFILMVPLKIGGIALASAIAGTIDFLILFFVIEKRLGGLNSGLFNYFLKVTFAAVITGFIEYAAWQNFAINAQALKLFLVGGGGFLIFGVITYIFGVEQSKNIAKAIPSLWKRK